MAMDSTMFAALVEALPVIASLVVIEGLLSVDNALAIAAMAAHLPPEKQRLALRYGIVGAYVFRGVALGLTSWIIANPWIKVFGALYLIYLMCSHLTRAEPEEEGERGGRPLPGLLQTVLQIELMDLSLSIDNVVAAVILSPKLWVVCTGVFIGILALRFVAGYCIRLLQRFPILAQTAFLLVGFVGMLLFYELGTGAHVSSLQKFGGICAVMVCSLLYGRFAGLRAALFPVLRVVVRLMRLFALACDAVFWPLRELHRMVRRIFARRPAPEAVAEAQKVSREL
jgi:YkoY family integral membrane protein